MTPAGVDPSGAAPALAGVQSVVCSGCQDPECPGLAHKKLWEFLCAPDCPVKIDVRPSPILTKDMQERFIIRVTAPLGEPMLYETVRALSQGPRP